jgi:hypothetical protein
MEGATEATNTYMFAILYLDNTWETVDVEATDINTARDEASQHADWDKKPFTAKFLDVKPTS